MGKFIDLTGCIFGSLNVIKRVDDYITPKGQHMTRWVVHCSCNRSDDFFITSGGLKRYVSPSCLLCRYEKIGKARVKDLTNIVFGQLTVIERSVDYVSPQGKHSSQWLCRCDCGRSNDFIVHALSLMNKDTKNCFICGNERRVTSKLKDLAGETFGYLTILELDTNNKKSRTRWICYCDPSRGGCGNKKSISRNALIDGQVSCGCLKESFIASELKRYCAKYLDGKTEYEICINKETNYYLPYDIYIPCGDNPEINGVYIEVNDRQHYMFTKHWHRTEEEFKYQKKKDKMKRKFARQYGSYVEIDLRKIKTTEDAIQFILERLN